ncbi:MAG: hypothetical protein IJY15_15125, partial [Thermoguttaceae bacterium]|nr:hypothetical protein [Thermoguttaceae bacterium]
MSTNAPPSFFIYLTCQRGAEPALKKEMEKRRPNYRFSYSRPGFLTFKLPEPESLEKRLALDVPTLRTVFARSCVHSLGNVFAKNCAAPDGSFDVAAAVAKVWELAALEFGEDAQNRRTFGGASNAPAPTLARIHVYERDRFSVGTRGFEPGL